MVDTVEFKGVSYPKYQCLGNAQQFSRPFALHVLKGENGLDIGYGKPEWKFERGQGIDINDKSDDYHADNLPKGSYSWIHSSHTLEHVPNCWRTLQYWIEHLKPNGVLFLYLPDFSQIYHRPWSNQKHLHCLTPELLKGFLDDHPRTIKEKSWVSGVDLYNSFMVIASFK